jgi:hypothetical protein
MRARAERALADDTRRGRKLRADLRGRCGVSPHAAGVPIRVVGAGRSDEPPAVTGEPPHSTFKNGDRCHSPGGAVQAGFRVKYHPDSRVVTVGARWLCEFLARPKA